MPRTSRFCARRLYGTDLTEDQVDAMVAAAGRRLERRKQAVEPRAETDGYGRGVAGQPGDVPGSAGLGAERVRSGGIAGAIGAGIGADGRRGAESAAAAGGRRRKRRRTSPSALTATAHSAPEEFRKVERAFEAHFAKPLPVSAMGETAVHRALGFDHRGRVDVALNPDQPEGKWLREYLKANRIPFFAFWQAVPGKATGAHIHIGPMSTRLAKGG